MPTVSVIIPNYNHAKYLRRRIDSVLAQTYQDFDVLLMDDCSTDNSREILSAYLGDPRVRLLFNDANSGSTFKQWNKGIREVSGRYIWLAESDDFAAPTLLERLVATLEANPDVGIAYCESYVIDQDNRELRTTHKDYLPIAPRAGWKHDFVMRGTDACSQLFSQQNVIPNASAAVFRRELHLVAGGADESMRLCGDWKLWASILLRSDLAHIAEPLNYYRTHSQNVRTAFADWRGANEALEVLKMIHAAVSVDPAATRNVQRWLADTWINSWLWRLMPDAELKRSTLQHIREFDPRFNRHVASRVLQRAGRLACNGGAWRWIKHLWQRGVK